MKHFAESTAAALDFNAVTIAPNYGRLTRDPLNLAISAGELVMIGVSDLGHGSTFADVAGGMIPAASGKVSVLGQVWSQLNTSATYQLRGRIGRLLTRGRWYEGMTILETILLPQLHHTQRSRIELRREATASARHFGLPGIPTTDHRQMSNSDLQRAGCVRAFLGSPPLLLLEEPLLDAPADMLSPLANACLKAMYRGAAILWLTCQNEQLRNLKIPATRRYMASAGEFAELGI